uniref:Reprolysin n=1 Tax=Rhipicephalus zambeziensis TaxID=60191 RepID=A0A224YEI7_9ACAR
MEAVAFARILQILCFIRSFQAAQLPKYRAIAYPVVFDGRDEATKALKINDDITLSLVPSAILHDNFFVRTYKNGVPEDQYLDVEALQQNFYHDEKSQAAVILSEEDGTLKVEGVIGPNLKIRPTESAERSAQGHLAHIIESIEDDATAKIYGKAADEKVAILERSNRGQRTGFDSSKYNMEHIFPEVYCICDSWFRAGFTSNESLIYYLMVSLRVVNIRYRPLRNPKIQFVLAGMEISEWPQEHKYYKYLVGDDIDGYESLKGIVKYVKENSARYELFDMVYVVTGYDMVANYINKKEEALAGYAFVASVCSENRVELGEDRAHTYKGIRTMAHEMAHTLGCTHDGTTAEGVSKTFTPDAARCPWEDGYLMSYIEENRNSMEFSSCCKYDMQRMSWTYEGGCLHVNNSNTIPLNWLKRHPLPGEFLNLTTQCRLTYPDLRYTYYLMRYGTWNCESQCYVPEDGRGGAAYHWPMFLIDGTPCEGYRNGICISGYCLPDPRDGYRRRSRA